MFDCYATGKQSSLYFTQSSFNVAKMKDDQTRIAAPMFDCYATGKQSLLYFTQSSFYQKNER